MKTVKIVQISDLHCGSNKFDENLMNNTIKQINGLSPDLLIITGDLTMDGYIDEYKMALEYINQMKVDRKVIVPGNQTFSFNSIFSSFLIISISC